MAACGVRRGRVPLTDEELREFCIQEFERRFSDWKPILKGEVLWDDLVELVLLSFSAYPIEHFEAIIQRLDQKKG